MTNAPTKERSNFSEADGEILLDHAAACIEAALEGKPLPRFENPLANAPVVGIFVSLKRGSILRACCGSLNESQYEPLGVLIEAAAQRAALKDVRFPRISGGELPSLDLEVSVMHHLKTMSTNPNLRIKELTIGRHGLIITHPQGRGLLLPQVAAENTWDEPTFLQQVCRKANLPTDTWLRPEAELKQFSATIFHRQAKNADLDFRELPDSVGLDVFQYAKDLVAKGPAKAGKAPDSLKTPVSPTGWGLLIQTSGGRTEAAFRKDGTLGDLILKTASSLHNPGKSSANQIKNFLAFSHPIPLHPEDFPDRLRGLPIGVAITARKGTRTSVVIKKGPNDPVTDVLKEMGETPQTWAKSGAVLQCHLILNLTEPEKLEKKTPPVSGMIHGVRPPAVAGTFYPGTEKDLQADLTRFFKQFNREDKRKVRAVMLPHAGWKYCSDIIADTLGRIKIPDIVVIIGPKHTPLGSRWSISNAKRWKIPGAEIPLDEESVAYLAAHVKELEKEELAHQKEHGIEVILPFLHHLNPNVRIAPIVVGPGTYDDFVRFGNSLKQFRDRLTADGDDCLFIISSDLNHFAEDKVNREQDKKALDAFKSGNSRLLFDTCVENQISMCGMRPAVAVISSLGVDVEKHCPDIEVVRYETSARISNDPSRVVGYAGALLG
ncbi:MAG: AmmeMemoRadiSam system protein B [Verrucomicrobiales bacterium]|nr:AmmeMemoRadiSam system protein B [Verrucomicrobiales bacterium]